MAHKSTAPSDAPHISQQAPGGEINLTALYARHPNIRTFTIWLVGDTPLICHAWSEKARREMLSKQLKSVRPGREARDPERDFTDSLYEMGDGTYGFPVTGVKNAILSAAHKDKGVVRTTARAGLWLNAQMVRTRPALSSAVCDMPLVRIYGSAPEMREDMVRVGTGLNKSSTLAFRGQFVIWALKIVGRLNLSIMPAEALGFLVNESGLSSGLGEWRNEKSGLFGAYHLASPAEHAAWEAYADGTGAMPLPAAGDYRQAA